MLFVIYNATCGVDKWQAALEGIPYTLVVFLPEIGKAVTQNNQRTGDARLKEELVTEQHKEFLAWRDDPRATVIDTTTMGVTDAVQAIRNIAKK